MTSEPPPSFSKARKWSLGLNALVSSVAVLALALMVNYLAARHYTRWSWSAGAQARLSPLSLRMLATVTNPVNVTLYFDKIDPLFEPSYNLLKTYRYANDNIRMEVVHYIHEPGAAQLVKRKYKLSDSDRDMVIFECQGRHRVVLQSELSDIDIQPLVTGRSKEVKRTHFKGEAMFTSAIYSVISARQARAYFLEGHGEHDPEADDGLMGYARFAGLLRENNLQAGQLRLVGPTEIPTDCNLLIIPGPTRALLPEALEKIDRYLKQGGRLFALFNWQGVMQQQQTGLENLLAGWGVAVGQNAVIDEKSHDAQDKHNMVAFTYGNHPVVKPLFRQQLYLVLPRSVSRDPQAARGADAPQVDSLVYSSPAGRVFTDIRRNGQMVPSANDVITNVSLMVAVEKGGIRNVDPGRGATRIVVAGDSLFLNNNNIGREGNHELATHIVNWLLARNDLLLGVPPRPIAEYKLTMTEAQLSAARWILMGGFPGVVLLLGGLVWLRRRR
jgi:hypothetical protein